MITNTAIASFEGPRKSYFFPVCKEEMISSRQLRTLTELIIQNIEDDNEREYRLSSLDDLTAKDAEKTIFEFEMARW
jgi:hypothetical protein